MHTLGYTVVILFILAASMALTRLYPGGSGSCKGAACND